MEIEYVKTSSADEAYEKVKLQVNEEMLAKFKVKAKVEHDDSAKKIHAKGKGFGLELNFKADRVESDLSLSLLLKPLKGKINSELEKELKKVV